jgi:hypothetical protein
MSQPHNTTDLNGDMTESSFFIFERDRVEITRIIDLVTRCTLTSTMSPTHDIMSGNHI